MTPLPALVAQWREQAEQELRLVNNVDGDSVRLALVNHHNALQHCADDLEAALAVAEGQEDLNLQSVMAFTDQLKAELSARSAIERELLAALKRVLSVLPCPIWNEHRVLVWSMLDIKAIQQAIATAEAHAEAPQAPQETT